MKMPKAIKTTMAVTTIALALVAGLAAVSLASGGAGEEGASPMKAFGWQVLNFAILVSVISYFFGKGIRGFFVGRSAGIEKSIAEARQAKEAAEAALAEVNAKLATKDAEVREMIEASRNAGERDREMLIKDGERMSAKLIEQARSGIEFELKQAKESLKAEAAAIAIELAEQKIGHRLSPQEQQRLFEEALTRLEAGK